MEIGSDVEIRWTAHLLQLAVHGISRALVTKTRVLAGEVVTAPLNIDQVGAGKKETKFEKNILIYHSSLQGSGCQGCHRQGALRIALLMVRFLKIKNS